MPVTIEEVQKLIQQKFPGSDVNELSQLPDYRIVGAIRWRGFQKMSNNDRNRLVTQMVRNELGLKGINVGVLIPLTPEEQL